MHRARPTSPRKILIAPLSPYWCAQLDMPVPAPSQLPPFLSSALRDTGGRGSSTTRSPAPTAGTQGGDGYDATARQAGTATIPEWGQADSSLVLPLSLSLLVPPLNFDMISSGGGGGAIYRSGHPNERNFHFMSTLNLKTIIYLSSDDVRDNLQSWIDATHGSVKLLHFRLNVNKEPFAEMDEAIVADALRAILDRRNLPALVHCNKGKYRVGVITALIRRLQGWSITSIFDEYARFAGCDRVADEEVRGDRQREDKRSF